MANTFTKNIQLLLKLIKSPYFKFVLILYKDWFTIPEIKKQIQDKYPDKKIHEIKILEEDSTAYDKIMEAMFSDKNDILFFTEFNKILDNNDLALGINQKRDHIAKYNKKIIAFMPYEKGAYQKCLRIIPDLWSFRNLTLEFTEIYPANNILRGDDNISIQNVKSSNINIQSSSENELQRLLEKKKGFTKKTSFNLRSNVYKQIITILQAQKKYKLAIKEIENFLDFLNQNSGDNSLILGWIYNELGRTYYNTNQFNQAEKNYQEALKIRRQLSEKNPYIYLSDVAMMLNNMATLQDKKNETEKAEKNYQEALKIRRQLSEKNPDIYLPDMATTLDNMATLQDKKNEIKKAEKNYQEALKIRRQLSEKNPDIYLPDMATTLNNMATLQYKKNETEKAEKNYQEALKIRRQLSEKNPDIYLPYVADTINNLAILQDNKNETEKAEKNFKKALKIRRQLSEKNPDVYFPAIADNLNNLATLQFTKNETEKAEKNYQEALKIYRQLSEKNPAVYEIYLANILINYFSLKINKTNLREAKEILQKYPHVPWAKSLMKKAKSLE
ncbi:MAG: tetratricopeptide repeat protein [Candidatus Aenigmarchaeota archaeon]|nr:tetratricopeptide repeat protein [Candidatus Aenigmarchaeota archaeon]